MIEIREDLISEKKVIINDKRSFRPKVKEEKKAEEKSVCFFCPGNEKLTPPEIERVNKKKSWSVRVFPNKFPILSLQRKKEMSKGLNKAWLGHGNNEVIVLTEEHDKNPLSFSIKKWFDIFKTYKNRLIYNYTLEGVDYVLLFHNEGMNAGASIRHSHSQALALPFIPNNIIKESNNCSKGSCCEMVKEELKNNRLIYKNKDFIIFCNYASRFPYEVHVYPINHFKSLTELSDDVLYSLSEAVYFLMKAYKKVFKDFDFNYVIHNAPKSNDYHFHLEFYPRFNKLAGVELGTEAVVNTVFPEVAAGNLRRGLK